MPARVVIVRGHLVTPWELLPWRELPGDYQVEYLISDANQFDPGELGLRPVQIKTLRDRMPRGRIGEIATGLVGDRYLGLEKALAGAQIVHAEELSFWFAAEAARLKEQLGYRLVQTVWETLPMLSAYRNRHARRNRERVLAATDLFLPATERARDGLLLEGVEPERIEVCPPGIDLERFRSASAAEPPGEHLVISPGRLVWEKGHQDVLRAVAALRRGIVALPAGVALPRVLLVGHGPEEQRLRSYADELGIGAQVEFAAVPYEQMPARFASASCMVLASLPAASAAYHPFDHPRAFWEEQFGYVLAEAMAAGLDILTTTSGAIPEVAGDSAEYFAPGDWIGLARLLADGPLSRPPGARVEHPRERVERYSTAAAAERLAGAYERLLARESTS